MVDVLVVGAGPTGLTLALQLSRWGLAVRVVDQADGPQQGGRGFGIKPRTLEVFDALGLADQFLAADGTAHRTKVYLGQALLTDFTTKQDAPAPARPFPNYVALPQWRTVEILRAGLAAQGVEVEYGVTLASFTDHGSSVSVEFADGSRASTAYLVGCDGGRSTVRKQLGIGFAGSSDTARAMLADVDVTGLADHAVHLWASDQQMLVLRPYREGEPWQAVASLGDEAEPSLEWLQQTVVERTGIQDLRVSNLRWTSVWRYSLRIADRYRVGRVFLAGDAAHVHSPFGAFGMNTGVQDANNLAWKLALVLQGAGEELLDTYEAERLPVGRQVLEESDRRFSSATAPPRILQPFLRFLVKPFLVRLNRRGRTDHPSYPTSPLTVPGAGGSAPDGVGLTAAGEKVRLFELFRHPGFTVLAFGVDVPVLPGPVRGFVVGRDLIDVDGNIRRSYPKRAYALIRPDGYLASLTDDAAELESYLRRWSK
ncbi:FAD-dependent monooxygenase [Kribbella sp. NBC_01505]|uniref:FAD-dependent monooxygenase n=1 Tax=Kribbella sp. NBC_01505 TaxID=2903580 RepID=UPI003863AA4D